MAIPCKMFKIAIKQAPDTEILIKDCDNKIKITTKNYTSEIPLHEYNPGFKEDTAEALNFKIKSSELRDILEKVEFSTSCDPENVAVNCVRLETEDNKLTAVGTDTYRLAMCETEILEPKAHRICASIPLKAVKGLIKALKSKVQGLEGTVLVMSNSKEIIFKLGSVEIRANHVSFSFPDYKAIIKGLKNDKKVMLNTKVFLATLKKAVLVAKNNKDAKNGGILDFRGGRLTVKAVNGFTEFREKIDTVQTGEDLKISLNLRFLADYLHKSKDSLTVMEMSNERNAVLIRGETDSKWVYLIMPLALRE